jgi:hypothetical protein
MLSKDNFLEQINLLRIIRNEDETIRNTIKPLFDEDVMGFYLPLMAFNRIEKEFIKSLAKQLGNEEFYIKELEYFIYETCNDNLVIEENIEINDRKHNKVYNIKSWEDVYSFWDDTNKRI